VRLIQAGTCELTHGESGARIHAGLPPEYGGDGRSFSATDLVAGALGACVATSIDAVALRHGISLNAIEIRVDKELGSMPKKIDRIGVTIAIARSVPPDVVARLRYAADSCAVYRTLRPTVPITIRIQSDHD
jgi:putative redox protein